MGQAPAFCVHAPAVPVSFPETAGKGFSGTVLSKLILLGKSMLKSTAALNDISRSKKCLRLGFFPVTLSEEQAKTKFLRVDFIFGFLF